MRWLKVLVLTFLGGVLSVVGQNESSTSSGVSGFQFELFLLHLAELESRMEDRMANRMKELERKVVEVYAQKVEQLVKDQTRHLEYVINQPAVFRDGGWTTIQHRFDGSVDFYRNYTEYRHGFGDVRGEFWLGLDKLHQKTRSGRHELLVVLEDHDGAIAHAHYDDFRVGGASEKYGLKKLGNYLGTAGDSLRLHENKPFSTYDKDNTGFSGTNCAIEHFGAWWFKSNGECTFSHLNGKYYNKSVVPYEMGVHWHDFRGDRYSLKSCKMMIRKSFT